MISFKKKSFAAPAIAAAIPHVLNAVGIGAQVGGMVQTGKQGKAAAEQAEAQMREQRRLQNQQIKAQAKQNQQMMDTLKQVAQTNPTVAGAAAGQQIGLMQQKGYAISADQVSKALKTAKGSTKDILAVSKKLGAHKKLATGLAMGATAAGASYLVDKGIQIDAKRSGIDLGEEDDERKKNGKKLGKAALLAGGTALAVLGAKKGAFGKSVQGTAKKYLTKGNASKAGETIKTAFKEQFYDPKKMAAAKTFKDKAKAVNGMGLALTAGFAAMPAIGYISNKKAIKEQTKQSEEQQREYAAPAMKGGAKFMKSAANFGKTLKARASKTVKGLEPMIKKQGMETGKAQAAKKGVASFKEAPVRSVLGRISSFMGGGGQEGTAKFTEELAKQAKKSGNTGTAKAAEFLDKHKTLAVGGSIAVGSLMFKPFGLGEKAVRTTAGAVDKNSMRYEKSQNKNVDEE